MRVGGGRDQRGGQEPRARHGIEVLGPHAQITQVQVGGLDGRDDHRGGAGPMRFGKRDPSRHVERRGDACHGIERFGAGQRREMTTRDRDPHPRHTSLKLSHARLGLPLGADLIGGVGSLDRVEDQGEIGHRACEGADVIEGRRQRKYAGARDAPECRLEAKDPAERGRHPDRAVGVRAEGKRHEPGGDGGGRASRRASRDSRRVVRIARRSMMRVLGGEAVGVLVHVGDADQDGPGAAQRGHRRSVARGRGALGLDLGSRHRRDAGDVEQILGRERHAGERPGVCACSDPRVELRRLR